MEHSGLRHHAKFYFLIPMAIAICLLLLLCSVSIYSFVQKENNDALIYSNNAIQQIEARFENIMQSASSVCNLLQYNSICQEIMSASYFSQITPSLLEAYQNIMPTLSGNIRLFDDIAFYTPLWYSSRFFLRNNLQEFVGQMSDTREVISLGLHGIPMDPSHFYLLLGYNYRGKAPQGAIFLSVDVHSNTQFPSFFNSGFYPALIGGDGCVCFIGVSAEEEAADPTYARIRSQLADGAPIDETLFRSDPDFYFQVKSLPEIGCTLVGVTNRRSVSFQQEPVFMIGILSILCLVISFLIWFTVLNRRLLHPLLNLNHFIEELKGEDILSRALPPAPKLDSCKEIDHISASFFELLEMILDLSKQIRQTQDSLHEMDLLRKDAEIQSLQHQINPHFLYNTLELIRADALRGDAQSISDTIAAMGKMYRYSVDEKNVVSLSDELAIIKAYICIQQHRYEGALVPIFDIQPATESVPIPKMLLQPLVENSFVHGLEFCSHSGTLLICTRLSGSDLTIGIRDDGLGIPADRLAQIRHALDETSVNINSSPAETSIGLQNVYRRLLLHYGEGNFDFSITSTLGDGTCVTLRIPC